MSRAERINALIVKWQIKVGSNRSNSVDQEIIKNLAARSLPEVVEAMPV
ncbi:hypothetical protein A1I_03550 [Rickettsia bellii OSU 85-389]|nr:hypothetical protein [Rickettsia bellii]ABV79069.1 hypothetical protein A1I_03550 [Rickettsia bellii OSU 85-389]